MNLRFAPSCYFLLVIGSIGFFRPAQAAPQESLYQVGVAKIDITPAYPIRLSGYAARKKESEGVAQHLHAKALAIGSDKEGPAILLTVDNTGVPASVRNGVVHRLQTKRHINPERVALCSSHSHTAPCLAGNLPTLFGEPLPPEHEAHIQQYTRELIDALEKVALQALKDRQPSKLSWGETKAGFAANRRTKGGPVDHDLPILIVTDSKDNIRAILANYACHCTTLGGETNLICADWAGYAQEDLERAHSGAIVLTAIGCGADSNPEPRASLDLAKKHGQEFAAAVDQVLAHTLVPITGKLECRTKPIELPFDKLPTRQEWEQKTNPTNTIYVRYYAKMNLAKLDRGEQLPAKLPYLVQSWNFGNDLAMVFLPGEVVVDYSLRLKKEFDATRLWINAYANDVPCYIPSERILKEGGYEGGGAMVYYDKPTRLAPGIEALIVNAVHDLVPKDFLFDQHRAEFPPPKSLQEALASIQTKAGFVTDLAACEPLVVDPVAIDWGADGKLWVVEMRDYPMGMDGNWKPGSRIKVLEDTKGTGKYDKATVFLDGLPFATGVTAWRKGALICTAPDILYAEDTDGDGHADVVKKVFTGFNTGNYQARVNSLSLGLDNWIYGANGLLGGIITNLGVLTATPGKSLYTSTATGATLDIRGRDFRINPNTWLMEPASGLTQQGRARDDWGNWLGCDNSTAVWHYPVDDHYLRRNPHVAAPTSRVAAAAGPDPNLVHPISRALERFNNPGALNHVTSGCGIGVYRDDLFGEDYFGNAFVCEPVHNLVHRMILKPNGVTLSAVRPAEEKVEGEFFSSRDNWCRPVQMRTGPDGAIWIVDMYRFVIEHPRWIPPDRLAKLDPRAGDDKGRIFRVYPKDKKLRPIPNLTKMSSAKLAAALDTPNGMERDRIHQELVYPAGARWNEGSKKERERTVEILEGLAKNSKLPAVRLQAACVLDGLNELKPALVQSAMSDSHPAVRANAVRLAEKFADERFSLDYSSIFLPGLLKLADDPELIVRYQLALTLGEWDDARVGDTLGKLAVRDIGDEWMRAAILSSATRQPAEILKHVLTTDSSKPGRSEMVSQLIATAAGEAQPASLTQVINTIAPSDDQHLESWQLSALVSLLDALERKKLSLSSIVKDQDTLHRIDLLFAWATKLAGDAKAKDSSREAAVRLLGRTSENKKENLELLAKLLDSSAPTRLQNAALDTLKRNRSPEVAGLILANWNRLSPSIRQAGFEVLLSRDPWTRDLLDGIEKGVVARSEISMANRQRLLKSSNKDILAHVQEIWKSENTGTRAEVVARYQSALTLTGDSVKGATLFRNTCTPCHYLRGQGNNVGPNLGSLTDKSPSDFLTAILDPNAAVEPRFIAYNIETKDGRSLTGVISAETGTTITLVQSGGTVEKILRSDLAEIRASGLSMMPEGLEQNLTPQDLADLIAYLNTAPHPFGSATPEQAATARKKFIASGVNGVTQVLAAAERLPHPSWMGDLSLSTCRQTDGNSRLKWQTSPVPADLKPDAIHEFRLPVGMGYASQKPGTFSLRLNGQSVLDFNVTLHDQSWHSPDGKVQMSYTVMEDSPEDSNGILSIRAPGSMLEPGKPATFEVIGSAANSQRWFGVYLLPSAVVHASR